MKEVKAKKHLGQHFLRDLTIAQRIADCLTYEGYDLTLEIGPGMGVLTQYLLQKRTETHVIEIDKESVQYLNENYPQLQGKIHDKDFLKFDFITFFSQRPMAIIGNFPYNISTQIVFKAIENRAFVIEFGGMFQKEVAERICEKPGSKAYGILSVLTQAFFDTTYLFTVDEHVFSPPPKVKSGVMMMVRKANFTLPCNERLFFTIVKASFNQRRKTLRNSLKQFLTNEDLKNEIIFNERPEQLSVEAFISLTQTLEKHVV
jgi:16S rRNA (adenine1518-N6/adenine1519-N6)-dimethyltransferase